MKYLLSLVLAGLLSSSLVFAQGRRHYGHVFPVIADACPQDPIEFSGKSHDAILTEGDEKWNSKGGDPHCNGAVYCISDDPFRPIIGGEFDSINGQQIRGIGRYRLDTDSTFTEIGGGVSGGAVYAIYETYESGQKIFAAGNFKKAGNISVNNIAYWDHDDNEWHAMGTGTNSTVLALTIVGDLLYVGGNFTHAGDSVANYIAIWNMKTNKWSPVIVDGVNGMDGGVATLANDYLGNVYAGGGFVKAGPSVVNKIAVFNKNSWNAIDSGVSGTNAYVSVAYIDPHVSYLLSVGGSFSKAGTINVSNYAAAIIDNQWDSAYTIRFDGPVHAITNPMFGDVIGGEFTHADGNVVNNISEGSDAWGSGVDGPVYALMGQYMFVSLAVTPNSVFVGGAFKTAGGKSSPFFAVHEGPQQGSVEELNGHLQFFRIYPNPASTEIAIENSENITELTIVDAVGRSILTSKPNQSKSPISIANIPDGFYTAMIKSNGKMYSQKLIIEH